jgi:hypothetical protein
MERVSPRWIRIATRAAGCAIVVLSAGATAACSPTRLSITGVYLEGGQPAALFHPCGGSSVVGIIVSERVSSWGTDSRHWDGIDPTRDRSAAHPTQVRLLELPAGWVQQTTKPGALLTSFVDGRSYWIYAKTEGHDGRDVGVSFTPLDLRSLGDGQVWAAPGRHADGRAMSREDFGRSVDESC